MLGSTLMACEEGQATEPAPDTGPPLVSSLIAGGTPQAALIAQTDGRTFDNLDQAELNAIDDADERFDEAFEHGDELFDTLFNEVDGVGANVGQGQRFTRVPRADLNGATEWANHRPARATGPNAESCESCHNEPTGDGAGRIETQAIRDPGHTGNPGRFVQRSTPHVFGMAGPQLLAEEMSTDLNNARNAGRQAQRGQAGLRTVNLTTKGVSFGSIQVSGAAACANTGPCTLDNNTGLAGSVDADLVIRPFQWKGVEPSTRTFARGAGHNELGMQGVEMAGADSDGDGDGVVNEFTVGDITALAVYLAGQPRPSTRVELSALLASGTLSAANASILSDFLGTPVDAAESAAIGRGQTLFNTAGGAVSCNTCHRSSLTVTNPNFQEPPAAANRRDATFPSGANPVTFGLDPANPVRFNITTDHIDNPFVLANGQNLGDFTRNQAGGAVINLFGDLKRHDMGAGLAESIDEGGFGTPNAPQVWMTENLWGAGSTAPYLHDGRATTLLSAILEHGGEATASRNAVQAMTAAQRSDLMAFLNNLVLFKINGEDAGVGGLTATLSTQSDWGAGFCQVLNITNNGDTTATAWQVVINIGAATITQLWNGNRSANTGTITVSSNAAWETVAPGATYTQTGFCANRNVPNNGAIGVVLSATGTF
jgi:cytochrome c peroxidase